MPDDALGHGTTDLPGQPASQSGIVADEVFKADFRWVRRGVQTLIHTLSTQGILPGDLGTVEIVVAEVLNNIVEHAYPEGAPGEIRVIVRRRSSSLMVEIRDRGRPMPKGRAPLGNHPMVEFNPNDAMPEGGYGWFLIRELVRDLVYDRKEDENILFFRVALGKPTPT
ncbi:ATP-binding protein [Silicimonas algicola]|uniref:Serine/threonine-protein kinase RsbW n=1 Tax=Silicimonas algicola TaxID=1826607 RepID=A0A316G2Y6_9RHOB|nr:ATP-binding protein [Silicimonas algicola]AZQ65881.1 ATP-binding protein [Silicimonas algicola]PWK54735.1 serine/threonine-protein kinase RsbW [Silicimonas algicola]